MKKTVLNLGLFTLVLLLSFTACQKQDVAEEVAVQNVEVDESLQQVLDQIVKYYQYHVPDFGELRSLPILRTLFN